MFDKSYIKTLHMCNKLESFLKNNKRALESSFFAFKDHLTLVSYVPKQNKAVILVSTKHHNDKTDPFTKKPVIIMDYNKFKGYKFFF